MKETLAMNKIKSIDKILQKELNRLPNQPILHSIIENRNIRDFFSSQPQNYILVKGSAAYTFLAGELDEAALKQVSEFLSSYENMSLICNERYHNWFLKNGYKICPRIELWYTAKDVELFPLKNNHVLKNLDANVFAKCLWYKMIVSFYGSPENFLNNGFGIALCENESIISEAYAGFIGDGLCEVGVATHPDYRGQGLATNTVAYLLKQCIDRKLTPVWSCDYENPASLKVVLNLGFIVKRYYAFLKKSNPSE